MSTEINITKFFNDECPRDYSASVAEIGNDAGPSTWRAANEAAEEYVFITDENRAEAVSYFRGFGAWSVGELEAMPNSELTALLVQSISGSMREGDLRPGMTEADWVGYEHRASEGIIDGSIYRGDGGSIFVSLQA